MAKAKLIAITEPADNGDGRGGGGEDIRYSEPYTVSVTVEGSADLLFHRWNPDAIDEKARAVKGSKAKKSDNLETYVWRTEAGELAIPGEYFRMSIVNAAKFKQDPRSPRKSAMDLYKAAIVPLSNLCGLGVKKWDYEDRRRVMVQRNGINRTRPAFRVGWQTRCNFLVNLPEYLDPNALRETIESAGRLIGIGDFRPTFGRYGIINFKVL